MYLTLINEYAKHYQINSKKKTEKKSIQFFSRNDSFSENVRIHVLEY